MKTLPSLALAIALLPGMAFAQSDPNGPPPPSSSDSSGDVEVARPPSAQPRVQPPAPPSAPPHRAQAQVQGDDDDDGPLVTIHNDDQQDGAQQGSPSQYAAPSQQAAPAGGSGQWVYTAQYGWIWMPYGNQYVDEGVYGGNSPYAYVYCNSAWSWVAAPWLWGWGAYPFFGAFGPARFGWYRGLYHGGYGWRSEEHTSELQSLRHLVCRLLLEKK